MIQVTEVLFFLAQKTGNHDGWIIYSGATDHMTFDPCDFYATTQPKRTCIVNANGGKYPVIGAGTIAFSPSFSLPNTLLVPSLSIKLLSVGQLTEELNCCALMYPTFCLFQDILTKRILAVVLKRRGCITWMSVMVEQILCILLKLRKGRFGYGIIGWGIPHFGI